jgi:hypothetical protein
MGTSVQFGEWYTTDGSCGGTAHCSPNVPTTCAAIDSWAPLGVVNTHKYGCLSRHSPAKLIVDVTEIGPLLGMTLVTSMVVHGGRIGSEQSTPVQPSKHTHPMLRSHRPRPLQYPGHFFSRSSKSSQLRAQPREGQRVIRIGYV